MLKRSVSLGNWVREEGSSRDQLLAKVYREGADSFTHPPSLSKDKVSADLIPEKLQAGVGALRVLTHFFFAWRYLISDADFHRTTG